MELANIALKDPLTPEEAAALVTGIRIAVSVTGPVIPMLTFGDTDQLSFIACEALRRTGIITDEGIKAAVTEYKAAAPQRARDREEKLRGIIGKIMDFGPSPMFDSSADAPAKDEFSPDDFAGLDEAINKQMREGQGREARRDL
jgi:hypothetical protein